MLYRLAGFVLFFFVAISLTATTSQAAPAFEEGRILVQPKPGLPDHALTTILQRAKGVPGRKLTGLDVRVVEVPPQAEEAIARALSRHPAIKFAELDRRLPASAVPNDPYFGNAWHLTKVEASRAWDVAQGANVVVAVLDTGFDVNHPDLIGKLLSGWNTVSNNTDLNEAYAHGSAVAGVIAATTNNGAGVAALGWQSRILPVRITTAADGYSSTSEIAEGIAWAASHGAKIVNVSFDVAGSSTVEQAAANFRANGGLVVASAGNTGTDRGYNNSTAVIHVSGTTSLDAMASWSSFGNHVDVSAPGVNLLTTIKGGGYGGKSGNSFSSPLVASVLALMRSANPALGADQLEQLLKSTTVDLGGAGYDRYFGHGRVNAAAAVLAAKNASASDTTKPTVSITAPTNNGTISATANIAVNANDNVGVTRVDLYFGGVKVASESLAPYQFAVDTTARPDGNVVIQAVAVDAAGNTNSSSINASVRNGNDAPPQVTISNPLANASVSGRVSISAFATDDNGVSMLTVSVDGKLLCSGSAQVSCTWNADKASAGAHNITARATDTVGNSSSASVSINVNATTGGRGKPKG